MRTRKLGISVPVPLDLRTGGNSYTEAQWLDVATAASGEETEAAFQAQERLCAHYWDSIYWFLHRQGMTPADAEDITQDFFANLISSNTFARANRERGEIRSFLLGALRRYQSDVYRRNCAQKRGKDSVVTAFAFEASEREHSEVADPMLTPDESFDRRWATTVLNDSLARMKLEFNQAGNSEQFIVYNPYLLETGSEADYAAMANRLDINPKSIHNAVCRFRARFREVVYQVIRDTVAQPKEVHAKFRDLFH